MHPWTIKIQKDEKGLFIIMTKLQTPKPQMLF